MNIIIKSVSLLFGLNLTLSLLLILLIDQFFLESSALMSLLLKPSLLLDHELLLAILHVPLVLTLFLLSKLFTQGMRLSVLALLHETLKDLLVLQERCTRLKSK